MKSFKTESKKILNMMINSIYTHKDIFLRELISNASDAIDKLHYSTLVNNLQDVDLGSFEIKIVPDKDKRTLTISDNGIGMTQEELENNLGTIAKSGSLSFKQGLDGDKAQDIDIIGQFGVGFYSAFMVAKKVEVLSKPYGTNQAFLWSSQGEEGYEITPSEMNNHGTIITLYLKDNTENENYDEYLEEWKLSNLIKKYSDYIKYPIKLLKTKTSKDGNEQQTTNEYETINSMIPLWKKNKSEISEEEYNNFYCDMFYDDNPIKTIHTSVEGNVEYKALLFVPATAQFNYYTKEFEKGLKLYTNGVLIMDKCPDLIPDHFSFVRGLVDCNLSLNISRETVQQDRSLKLIANNIENKIKQALLSMLETEREKYEQFFDQFGLQLKYGTYANWGIKKELLQDLLLFKSIKQDKYITLDEYVQTMPKNQKQIFYATGKTFESIKQLPSCEETLSQGYDILCFCDDIDEFMVKVIHSFKDKEFANVSSLKIEETTDEKDKELESFLKDCLNQKVSAVKITTKLKTHPVCLMSGNDVSIEMERLLSNMQTTKNNQLKAEKVLQINKNHEIFAKISQFYQENREKLTKLVNVLFAQAQVIEGIIPDNMNQIIADLCELLK